MKQTAVEWLANELLHLDHEFDMKLIDKNEYQTRRKQVTKQAKAMEKERIIEFTNDYILTQCSASFEGIVTVEMSTEKYYELTFKSE
jgi:hypothetical protein